MSDDAPINGFGEWNVESLRLSVFYSERPSPSGLWEQVMGIAPESSETRAREGIVQERGLVDGNVLLLVARSSRLDWNLLPAPSPIDAREGPPTLMAADQGIPVLRRALDVSVRACGLVERLALGSELTRRASNLSEGLKQLSEHLPRLDLENLGGSDFAYQINRRRMSPHVPHVWINRLSRWQLAEIQSETFTVGPSGTTRLGPPEVILVSKLTLDINTALGSSAFASDKAPNLFDDLAQFASEIAIQGDIP
jgi:hypothetical protein